MSLLFFSKMRFCKKLLLWYRSRPTKWKKKDAEDWTSMPVSQVFTSDLFLSHPMYWTLEHIYQFSFSWHESNSQELSPYCKPKHAKYGQLVDSLQKLTPNSGKNGSEHRYQHLLKLMDEESTQGLAWRNSKLFRFQSFLGGALFLAVEAALCL